MEAKVYIEMRDLFTRYLIENKLRRTEERYTIFEHICTCSGHFDIAMFHDDLEQKGFHVSKATLYNTLEVLVEAGVVVRHQWMTKPAVQYELKILADTHLHLICTKCGAIREIRNKTVKASMDKMKITRFTPDSYCMYVYGVCSKCKCKMLRSTK